MFTGIVEELGTITSITPSPNGGSTILTISTPASFLTDAHDGDSISINGTCLTITSFTPSTFTISISPETLRRTNLGTLHPPQHVNLERAVSASTRMGGHFVQGHVDTTAIIASLAADGDCLTVRLRPRDAAVLRYVVEKGYVCLDGASLTVTRVQEEEGEGEGEGEGKGDGGENGGWFEVMLITYTQDRVVMSGKREGEEVNVEVDMVGKYVEKSVRGYLEGMDRDGAQGGGGSGGGGGLLERMVGRMVGRMVDERMRGKG